MSSKVTIEYFGMEGVGKNVTEAKRNAGHKIEKAIAGNYTPRALSAGDDTVILFRSPVGWQYAFLRGGELCSFQGQSDDLKEVEKSARRHIGSNATDWRTCFGPESVHEIVKDAADRREIAASCQWQRDYHKATEAGLDDNNARLWVGGLTHLLTQPIPEGLTRS